MEPTATKSKGPSEPAERTHVLAAGSNSRIDLYSSLRPLAEQFMFHLPSSRYTPAERFHGVSCYLARMSGLKRDGFLDQNRLGRDHPHPGLVQIKLGPPLPDDAGSHSVVAHAPVPVAFLEDTSNAADAVFAFVTVVTGNGGEATARPDVVRDLVNLARRYEIPVLERYMDQEKKKST